MAKDKVDQAEKRLQEKGQPVNYMTLARELGGGKERGKEIADYEREKKQKGGGK